MFGFSKFSINHLSSDFWGSPILRNPHLSLNVSGADQGEADVELLGWEDDTAGFAGDFLSPRNWGYGGYGGYIKFEYLK